MTKNMRTVPSFYVNGVNRFYNHQELTAGIANNAFSISRKPIRDPLKITPLCLGSMEDLQLGNHTAFQDFDGDVWMECKGLKQGILCLDLPVPIYVVDNHNHAFYAWCEALFMNWFSKGASLIHMDAHYDDTLPPHVDVDVSDMESVWNYTNQVLQIATFVKPALQLGIFSDVHNFVESSEFEREYPNIDGQVVLNIDLDVFCEEMSHVTWQQKLLVLKQYLPQTRLITMSTSPFFIDQEKAIFYAKRVVQELFSHDSIS